MTSPLPQPPSTSGRTNRRSYFQEGPMEEHTPTHFLPEQRRQSLPSSSSPQPQPQSQPQTQTRQTRPLASFAASLSRRGGEELLHVGFWADGRGRPALRVLNAAAHLVACSVLLAIVVQFLVRYRGKKSKSQAIAMTTLVAIDCCLDLYSAARRTKKWQGWALLVRLLLSLSYMAQFFVNVELRKVFPDGYSYWGMGAGYSEPVVYMLLWVIGIWDLLHTAIHRHALGRDLCRYALAPARFRRRQATGSPRGDVHSTLAASRPYRRQEEPSRGQMHAGHDPESQGPRSTSDDGSIGITDARTEEIKSPEVVVRGLSRADSSSGESSSQKEALSREKSTTSSNGESSRTSTTVSGDTLGADEVDRVKTLESR